MSDLNDNRALFDQIKALAQVDYRQAASLARDAGLVVRTREGTTGVLTGVDWLGHPEISVHQRTDLWTHLRFGEIEAAGHRWEAAG